ncbi:MAG: caspase family protein, partial [Myxococcota bacterium]
MRARPLIRAHTTRSVGALALSLTLLASGALAETRRIAIVVGNNAGSGDMPPLRFAESDAGKMARVLVELGDVTAEDVLLLQGRGVAELERAIGEAKERVSFFKKSPDVRSVVLFYFSGHSDGEAI